jgi:hypothetical protein
VLLGQRRTLIGAFVLGADQQHASVEALRPERLGGLGTGQARPDDDEGLISGHGISSWSWWLVGDACGRALTSWTTGKDLAASSANHHMKARRTTPEAVAQVSPVVEWRRSRLVDAGFGAELAAELARDCGVDLHAMLELTDRGCPPALAARILAPLDDRARPC